MALIDIVKYDQYDENFIVEKFGSEHNWELRYGTQLIVNEGLEAILEKGGVALDAFTAGTHTITSGNIPLLRKLVNLPFGGQTPFTAEVWFINKTVKRNEKWGTTQRIPIMEPKLGYPVNVGAFGQWGFQIEDSQKFLKKIVGAKIEVNSKKVMSDFIGDIVEKVSQTISEFIGTGLSVLEITAKLSDVSKRTSIHLRETFEEYGINLTNFTISNINIAPEEMKKIQEVFAKKMEAEQLSKVNIGAGFAAIKNYEVLNTAAGNAGAAGGIMGSAVGMGLGFGAGLPLGNQMAQSVMQNSPPIPQPTATATTIDGKLAALKNLYEQGVLTEEEYNAKRAQILPPASADTPENKLIRLKQLHEQGILTDEEFSAKKAKILEEL
ncbi:MAG: SPFH domain-containing protein [Chitinivibrionia bacterium]|nr:SPFH domain-containing protein [Chitinivibrionia bacterium]